MAGVRDQRPTAESCREYCLVSSSTSQICPGRMTGMPALGSYPPRPIIDRGSRSVGPDDPGPAAAAAFLLANRASRISL